MSHLRSKPGGYKNAYMIYLGTYKIPEYPVVRSFIPEVSAREALVYRASQESDIIMWNVYLAGSSISVALTVIHNTYITEKHWY